jgi:hypothetical protein
MINIADQFKVNISLPIDSRIVASGSTARNAIPYKYDGLVIYDGHHRLTTTWALGETKIKVNLVKI